LKVITHYGEFTGYKVKKFYKLIGNDVIIAHQLLKNNSDENGTPGTILTFFPLTYMKSNKILLLLPVEEPGRGTPIIEASLK